MPRMDGREALKAIKADEQLRNIPVVILTTSKAEEDIMRSYNTGANSYITKPVTFEGLVSVSNPSRIIGLRSWTFPGKGNNRMLKIFFSTMLKEEK